ncbi:MAG: SIS domain-containing protein [Deltaproteobacteria bacterium]|nr:SIS domain-containing protein [Deltaproteobacteria bacterium]
MCGVIGLIYSEERSDLGRVAAELLKTLEYRGYDSTGAAIQGSGPVHLAKGVGAPSVMVHQLGIAKLGGQILCGQVRWATFGAVDELNAQPHLVRCKTEIYGAHNGNVTNCDDLKTWLTSEGHRVASDNDGEMVVHTVEHYFAQALATLPADRLLDPATRREQMRTAILAAAPRLRGSYAAVVVDPVSRCLWSIKQGSSLYFGHGTDESGARFTISSSDLSAVLKLTRVLVPLAEGEFVEHDAVGYQVYRATDLRGGGEIRAGQPLERKAVRSRLRVKDTVLVPPFSTFMEQEIAAQERTCADVVTTFRGGTEAVRVLSPYLRATPEADLAALAEGLESLRSAHDDAALRRGFRALVDSPPLSALLGRVPVEVKAQGSDAPPEQLASRLVSSEAGLLADLLVGARGTDDLIAVRLLDVIVELRDVESFAEAVDRFVATCGTALAGRGRLLAVCCGSSYHAAKAGALFFNEVARCEVVPVLPGEFRGGHLRSLADGDVVMAISQSGETKDLIDIMNDVAASGRVVTRIALVNNVNSTLAQEKSDVIIPLRCGPEIAVPATKSFMNQLTVLYALALRLGQRRAADLPEGPERAAFQQELAARWEKLPRLPELIRETLHATEAEVDVAARLLYLRPSIQILATRITAVAKEGALKVREVVLNHTEGFEGSEFKHGPNTILGFNTIFGPAQLESLLKKLGATQERLLLEGGARGLPPAALGRLVRAAAEQLFSGASAELTLEDAERRLLHAELEEAALTKELYADYPLIYVTGPDPRDVALTVSQLNTHKIRGSTTVVIAEDHPELRQAAGKAPTNNPAYRSVYVALPRTEDPLLTVFSATVVLQRLALKMSLLKAEHLDRLGIAEHGVHPDVPKNVSKSITVD